MTDEATAVVMVVSGLSVLSGLAVNLLTIRKLNAPKPPNQDLDNRLVKHETEIADHTRRLDAIERARVECHRAHMGEIATLYHRVNTSAEKLAEVVGRLQSMFPGKEHR